MRGRTGEKGKGGDVSGEYLWACEVLVVVDEAYPCEICSSRFVVEIKEVENDSVVEVAECAVVDYHSFAGVDHLKEKKRK